VGANDNDMLERALDAAESKMSEDVESSEVVETPTSDPIEDAAIKDAIEESPSEPEPTNNPAKNEAKTTKDSNVKADSQKILKDQPVKEDVKEPEITTESESPAIDPPPFWSAEHKTLFAKAPKEIQQAISKYEAQRNEWASRLQGESERGKRIEARASEVFKPYELKLKANGIKDPFEAAERLLAWNELFEANPKAAIADLMAKNNLSPDDFANMGEVEQIDPRIAQIQKDAEEAKRSAEEMRTQIEQEREEAFRYQIQDFKNGKDSQGNVRKAFAEMYAPQIDQAFQAIQKIQPMPLEAALNQAYEYVLSEARKQFGNISKPAPTKTPEAIVAQAKKQEAASGSVTGAPKSGTVATKRGARTIDEALDRAEAKLSSRA